MVDRKAKTEFDEHKRTTCLGNTGIVIIGRNEGERLTRCLQSLNQVKLPTVYVDSGSVDGSIENARKFGAVAVTLDISKPFTAARARNEGFAVLKRHHPGVEFVQFIDGDCSLDKDWLSIARRFLSEHSQVAVVCGRRRETNPDFSVYNWLCDVEWETPIGEAETCGGDAFIHVAPFEACGGYRESLLAGEEPELCVRLRDAGWKIWRIDAEMTLHDAAITKFSQWWRRCKRGGYGMIEVATLQFNSPNSIWVHESLRAIVYGGLVPLILFAGLIFPVLLLVALVYPLQVLRLAIRRGIRDPKSWTYALMITISKFAEFGGIVSFIFYKLKRKHRSIIEYK